MLMQRVRAHALWDLGRRAEAVVELESVAAQGTEVPLHSLLFFKPRPPGGRSGFYYNQYIR